MSDEYNTELARRIGKPVAYINKLDRKALAGDRNAQAELEDIETGTWDGPRTDLS